MSTIDKTDNTDILDTNTMEELSDLFQASISTSKGLTRAEKLKKLLCSPGFNPPPSWVEAVELINRNKDKKILTDIKEDERFCYLLLNRQVSGNSSIGYQNRNSDKNSLIGSATSWSGIFILVENEDGILQELRLDDSQRVRITCSLQVSPEVIAYIDDVMASFSTQSINIGIVGSALCTYSDLTMVSRRERDARLLREQLALADNTKPLPSLKDEDYQQQSILLSQWSIYPETILPAPSISSVPCTDPTQLVIKLNQSTTRASLLASQSRRLLLQTQDNPPSSSPTPLDQMSLPDSEL